MTDTERLIRKALAAPRRDWRFWACLSLALLITCVTISFISVVRDKDDLKARFLTSNATTECRSRAAVFYDGTDLAADQIFSDGLSTAFAGGDSGPYVDAYKIANQNRHVALAARKVAIETCSTDPTYSIPETILQPIPPLPDGP